MNMHRLLAGAALAAIAVSASAQSIIYVDATVTNTTAFNGSSYGTFSPAGPTVSSGTDGLWRGRTGLANASTVFESNGATGTGTNTENAARLATTITGLTPGHIYNVYTYFWGAGTGNNWQIWSSLTDSGNLTQFRQDGTGGATLASLSTFATNPLFAESDRLLYQASLGSIAASTLGTITVYIDDTVTNVGGGGARIWYDGVGTQFVAIPEPSTYAALIGVAALLLAGFRRRKV